MVLVRLSLAAFLASTVLAVRQWPLLVLLLHDRLEIELVALRQALLHRLSRPLQLLLGLKLLLRFHVPLVQALERLHITLVGSLVLPHLSWIALWVFRLNTRELAIWNAVWRLRPVEFVVIVDIGAW